ncbi:cell division protein FtsZ, partial [Micromonospora sp. DH15]|nr:cell division protein FtsZ [Micromonospora sp. DH15]
AAQLVTDAAHPDANIIFGAVIDDALGDEVRVTVIAAGFDGGTPAYKPEPSRKSNQNQPAQPTTPSPPPATMPAPSQSPRRVLFDDVDVPDFLKNGS